jgi:cytoskeletal protein RodZ
VADQALKKRRLRAPAQGTFLRGFVRNYAKSLALDADAMLLRLFAERPVRPASSCQPEHPLRPARPAHVNLLQGSGLAMVLIVFGFAGLTGSSSSTASRRSWRREEDPLP